MNVSEQATRFVVRQGEAGLTLQEFLAERLGISKKKAKLLLDTRSVFVNRQRTWMARHSLSRGDRIELPLAKRGPTASTDGAVDRDGTRDSIRLLFEDAHYVVVDKASGILSNGRNSVETRLRVDLCVPSLTAVHRIDRDTSGCLLLAKTDVAFEKAVDMFKAHLVKKLYHVVVAGRVRFVTRTISRPIRDRSAVTYFRTLDANRDASHLRASIETGRTHQIRRHLATLDHPVVGDGRYGLARRATSKTVNISRQMLHASGLSFGHPLVRGKEVRINSDLPRDFRDCLGLFGLK